MEGEIMRLERENTLLKKCVKKDNLKFVREVPVGLVNCSVSVLKLHKNKASNIAQQLKSKVKAFKPYDLEIRENIASGVYGSVNFGYIKSMKQIVAVKTIHESMTNSDILAEAKISQELAGHPNFPYFYGFIKPNKLLFELVGDGITAPSLREIIKNDLKLMEYREICLSLCRALHHMHRLNILHNDIHPGNILVRNTKYAKLIDFGKASLASDPVLYSIKPGTPRHEKYNRLHLHLGFELRNVPGSYTSFKSDIYSMGYCMRKISELVVSKSLNALAVRMLYEVPNERPNLESVLLSLSKI